MIVKPLTEDHLEFLSLTGSCSGSSKSTHVKMPHCWKSHATAQMVSGVGPIAVITEENLSASSDHSIHTLMVLVQ